jgi:RNA polymerase sigma factor (sigma-70 family)
MAPRAAQAARRRRRYDFQGLCRGLEAGIELAQVATLTESNRDSRRGGDDDRALVAAIRRGDDDAFARLYERYRRRIAAYAYGYVRDHARAEDVTQDVFLSALRRMRCTSQPIAVQPWLYEIARNACIDQHRRGRRVLEVSYEAGVDADALVAPQPGPAAATAAKARLDDLCHAFRGLSPREHELLVLRDLEGLSYREISERLQLSRGAIESGLSRARQRLSDEYEDLSSGTRCRRVQSLISSADGARALAAFERVRVRSHILHCSTCRVHARRAGLRLEPGALSRRLAALLPIPAWLRRWTGGSPPAALTGAAGHAGVVAPTLGPVAAQWPTWTAATAVVATVGLAVGVGSWAAHPSRPRPVASHHARARAAAAPARSLDAPAPAPAPALVPARAPAPASRASTRPATRRAASHAAPAPRLIWTRGGQPSTGASPDVHPSGASAPNGASTGAGAASPPVAANPSGAGSAAPGGTGTNVTHARATAGSGQAPVAARGTGSGVATGAAGGGGSSGAGSGAGGSGGGLAGAASGASAVTAAGAGTVAAAGNAVSTVGSAVSAAGAAAGNTLSNGAAAAAGVTQAVTSASPVTAPVGQAVSNAVTDAGATAGSVTKAATGAVGGAVSGAGTAVSGLASTVSQAGGSGSSLLRSVVG